MLRRGDEYGLNLAHWLENKLNLRSFQCLQWISIKEGIFKIYWDSKGKPCSDESLKLFKAWATRDGEEKALTFSEVKSRLRDALKKNDGIEELKEKHVSNQQVGNYKVFRFLTTAELKDKKKQKRASKQKAVSSSLKRHDCYKSMECSQGSNDDSPCTGISDDSLNLLDVIENESYPMPCNQAGKENMGDSAKSNTLNTGLPARNISFQDYDLLQCAFPRNGGMVDPTFEESPALEQLPLLSCTQDFFQAVGIDSSCLQKFKATLSYEDEVCSQEELDFSLGCRFVFDGSVRGQYPDNLGTISFPPYYGNNTLVKKVLEKITDGIVLRTLQEFSLYGKRSGNCHIFYNSCAFSNEKFVEIKRKDQPPTCLFSYFDYIKHLKNLRFNSHRRSSSPLMIVFGTCPKSQSSKTLVSLKLEPVVAPQLKDKFDPQIDDYSTILCSDDSSLDALYKQFSEKRQKDQDENFDNWLETCTFNQQY